MSSHRHGSPLVIARQFNDHVRRRLLQHQWSGCTGLLSQSQGYPTGQEKIRRDSIATVGTAQGTKRRPAPGWARLDSIYAGRWDRWFPIPVKLDIKSFMEKDMEGHSHWYDLTKGQYIQGLVARDHQEQRIYVVTVTPELEDAVHERWPRVLNRS